MFWTPIMYRRRPGFESPAPPMSRLRSAQLSLSVLLRLPPHTFLLLLPEWHLLIAKGPVWLEEMPGKARLVILLFTFPFDQKHKVIAGNKCLWLALKTVPNPKFRASPPFHLSAVICGSLFFSSPLPPFFTITKIRALSVESLYTLFIALQRLCAFMFLHKKLLAGARQKA